MPVMPKGAVSRLKVVLPEVPHPLWLMRTTAGGAEWQKHVLAVPSSCSFCKNHILVAVSTEFDDSNTVYKQTAKNPPRQHEHNQTWLLVELFVRLYLRCPSNPDQQPDWRIDEYL